jgi:hypothetical protein
MANISITEDCFWLTIAHPSGPYCMFQTEHACITEAARNFIDPTITFATGGAIISKYTTHLQENGLTYNFRFSCCCSSPLQPQFSPPTMEALSGQTKRGTPSTTAPHPSLLNLLLNAEYLDSPAASNKMFKSVTSSLYASTECV